MIGWLLDTNVLSELRRPRPDRKVVAFVSHTPARLLYISSEMASNPQDRILLTHWLTRIVRPMFASRVLEITEDIMFQWRLLVYDGRKSGHTSCQPDLIIGATALHHDLSVVTRNEKDYDKTGVSVLNPWN